MKTYILLLLGILLSSGYALEPTAGVGQSPAVNPLSSAVPRVLHIQVGPDVKLEVVDWGGSGMPIVLLAALGADAHEFDRFAPKLTAKGHVLGITRRGFGGSSKPESEYSNEQLGMDLVAVLDQLGIKRALFIGHSIAGMELSWLASRHPERVTGLVYLEAAYGYAFYSASSEDAQNLLIDDVQLQKKLRQLLPGGGRPDQQRITAELLEDITRFASELRAHAEQMKDTPDPQIDPAHPPRPPAWLTGIYQGLEKYTKIEVPVLAIFAEPHAIGDLGDPDEFLRNPGKLKMAEETDIRRTESQAKALENGIPHVRVVRIPHAAHFILQTHEQLVLTEIDSFIDRLSLK